MAAVWKTVDSKLKSVLKSELQITKLTPVQSSCVTSFTRANADVICQAPTGSGKTLAFILPTLEHVNKMVVKEDRNSHSVYALILVPNRELAVQVFAVLQPLAAAFELSTACFVGGRECPLKGDVEKFVTTGGNIVVATPGRFAELIDVKRSAGVKPEVVQKLMRTCEVLIADECDRLLDKGFTTAMATILAAVPKQRRTGLFSATYIDEQLDELRIFALRNPVRVRIGGDQCKPTSEAHVEGAVDADVGNTVLPDSLTNYYTEVAADAKLSTLIAFLLAHSGEKVLVFFSTCACVDYFNDAVSRVWKKSKGVVLAVHGKKKKQRSKLFEAFSSSTGTPNSVMFATDVMARGVDIADIDWVVQFDPPRQSTWFIHRSGRTGRCGREGRSLVFLQPSELAYVDYMKTHQHVEMTKMEITVREGGVAATRKKLIHEACRDREFLERGTKALVSYIQSYVKHDCHVVCSIKDLDVIGVAHDYGVVRLPKMRELNDRDLTGFARVTKVNTVDVPYMDKGKEKRRLEMIIVRRAEVKEKKARYAKKLARMEEGEGIVTQANTTKVGGGRKKLAGKRAPTDEEELGSDLKLMQRLKKGRLTKDDFNSQFMESAN